MACLILSLTASLVMWSLFEMPSSFLKHLISVACNLFRMSAVTVQASQAYNSTGITRERVSLILELREICLSFQMVFSLASAAVVCAILEWLTNHLIQVDRLTQVWQLLRVIEENKDGDRAKCPSHDKTTSKVPLPSSCMCKKNGSKWPINAIHTVSVALVYVW